MRSTTATITFNYMFPNLTKCTMKLWKDNDELDWTWPPRRQYPDPILPFHLCKMHNCNITSRFIFILSEDWYGCQVKGNGCLLWLLVDFFSGWQLKSWLWFWQQTHSFCKCWKGNVWTGNPEREGVVSGFTVHGIFLITELLETTMNGLNIVKP